MGQKTTRSSVNRAVWFAWLALNLGLCGVAAAQWVRVDPAFPGESAPSEPVRALQIQRGGGLLVAGSMTNFSGATRMHLARLDESGTLDLSFAPELDDGVRRIETLPGGQILISGVFTNVDGSFRPGLARLHEDGSLDEAFAPPAPAGSGYSLIGMAGADGALFVTGVFTELGGLPANRLARLSSDGSVDPAFQSPFTPTNTLTVVGVQADGKPLVAGSFTNVAGISANNLVRLNLDGSVDSSFRSALAANERVRRAVLQPDGRLVAAVNAVIAYEMAVTPLRLVRFEIDGTLDPTFLVTLDSAGSIYTSAVYDMELQSDGKLLISGTFLRVNGVPRAKVARLGTDGTLDYCFDVALGAELLPLALAPDANDGIVVGGLFNGLHGEWRPNLIRLLPSTDCDPGVIGMAVSSLMIREDAVRVTVPVVRHGGLDQEQTVSFETRDGSALSGRDFEPTSGTVAFGRGERSQAIEVSLKGEGSQGGPRSFEVVLLATDGGASLAALTNAVVTVVDAPAGSAGAPDTNFVVQLDGPVRVILPMADGGALIAGSFTNVNGQPSPGLARLLEDGSRDDGFVRTMPLDGQVSSMALDGAGRLLIAGRFRHVDGQTRPGLARLGEDGALDQGFDPFVAWPTNALGYSVVMEAVCVSADGSVVCSGFVPRPDGTTWSSLFKISEEGVLDTHFTGRMPPQSTAFGLTALADGDLMVRGQGLGNSLIRLQPDGAIDLGFIPPADRQVVSSLQDSLGVMPDGRVVIAAGASLSGSMFDQETVWRLNPDGSLDAGFSPPPVFGVLGDLLVANLLSVAEDGRVLLYGHFSAGSGSKPALMRLHADGSPDWSFDPGTGLEPDSTSGYHEVSALVASPLGGWLIGGDFGGYDGFHQRHLVRLLPEALTRPSTFRLVLDHALVDETNATLLVEVWRRGDASGPASVTLRTEDGTAVGGEDYVGLNARLAFEPGEWSKTAVVTIVDDQVVEGDEQFALRLSDPTDGFEIVSPSSMTVTVGSEDAGVEFLADEFRGAEEDGVAHVGVRWHGTLSTGLQVIVNIVPVSGGSEDLGVDSFLVTKGNLSTNWFRIPILDDANREGVEEFRLELAGAAPVVPGPRGTATLVIEDHDFESAPGRGVAGVVEAIANAPQGGVYLVGEFTGVHGVPRNSVARLLPDGEVDLDFDVGEGPDGVVTAVGVQPDGKVIIGGNFTEVSGVSRAGVARLEEDGSIAPSFDPGLGAQRGEVAPFIRVILPREDGLVWIAGAFTHFDGHPSRLLVRLEEDGRVDEGFVSPFTESGSLSFPGIPPDYTLGLHSLLEPADGGLLAGGLMSFYFDTRTRLSVPLVRLDPEGRVIWRAPGKLNWTQANPVWALALTDNARILVGTTRQPSTGGWLPNRTVNTNWLGLSQLDANGQPVPEFQIRGVPPLEVEASCVQTIIVQPDGRILFSAAILSASTNTSSPDVLDRAVIGRLLPDGAWDSSFELLTCALPPVSATAGSFSDDFTNYGGSGGGPLPTASMTRQPDGVLVVAGAFHSVNGEPRRRLARLEPDGGLRGRLELELSAGDPLRLFMPGEVEVPYAIETSPDLEQWSGWLLIHDPWQPVEQWLTSDEPARYFRARPVEQP